MTEPTVTFWRPTSPQELAPVEASGWRAWPPRLPDQPIFYPVLHEDYATRIARDWYVKASDEGHVTRFQVLVRFLEHYQVHQVGGFTILTRIFHDEPEAVLRVAERGRGRESGLWV